MHRITGVFALRICQFVGFVISWCISYQTGAKFSDEIWYYIFFSGGGGPGGGEK